MGLVNLFQVWFVLKALEIYDGFIVFPLTSAGGLLFTTLVAVLLFRERLTRVIVDCGFAPSSGAATRLIDQGSVKIDGDRVDDRFLRVSPQRGPFVLQVGKRRVVRVRLEAT